MSQSPHRRGTGTSGRWFVRRRVGFGVRPVSWQGWALTAVLAVVVVVSVAGLRRSGLAGVIVLVAVGVYLAIGYATGGARRVSPPDGGDRETADGPSTGSEPRPHSRVTVGESERDRRLGALRALVAPEDTTAGALALEVNHLTKRFEERMAFDDVSFTVRRGEVFGFLGPNGAGKTTTVRTLATLLEPTAGSARVAGIPLTPENGSEIRSRISVMTEQPGLYAKLSVEENLEFFIGLYGRANGAERIRAALEAVNLTSRAKDSCASLSKGLRQRAGLARAFLNDPELIFLDEPTSGLDPVAAREVLELIESLRSRGVTIFLTTHRLEEAEKLCDRVAILNTTLRVVGRTEDLRAQLFERSLLVETVRPLDRPDSVFSSIAGVTSWRADGAGYVLDAPTPRDVAPAVVRALVTAGADVVTVAESHHSLEDVYLELVGDGGARP